MPAQATQHRPVRTHRRYLRTRQESQNPAAALPSTAALPSFGPSPLQLPQASPCLPAVAAQASHVPEQQQQQQQQEQVALRQQQQLLILQQRGQHLRQGSLSPFLRSSTPPYASSMGSGHTPGGGGQELLQQNSAGMKHVPGSACVDSFRAAYSVKLEEVGQGTQVLGGPAADLVSQHWQQQQQQQQQQPSPNSTPPTTTTIATWITSCPSSSSTTTTTTITALGSSVVMGGRAGTLRLCCMRWRACVRLPLKSGPLLPWHS
uniref:Uncharacterized protein n=1 Tax=Dunaliella tertiolecta TaxID=3047 RepID=A0A7S3VSU9_DUNTE